MFIEPFNNLSKNDIFIAGGKGASLGEMTKLRVPVPPGFVILVEAFDKFLEKTDLIVEIASQIKKTNFKDTKVLKDGDLVEVDAERGIVKILKRKE